jgi:hypothetical protein
VPEIFAKEVKIFIKNFSEWFQLKPKLDANKNPPLFVKEGEIYWFHCGENIGYEISGKNNGFMHPGIIYKKLSHYLFLIIPASSQIKKGSWFSVFVFKNKKQTAYLHQIRIVDARRLENYMGELPEKEFEKIKKDFEKLYVSKPF